MFTEHVDKELSPYCNGELADTESRRVAAHLMVCERCRRDYDQVRLGVRLAEQLPILNAPAEMWGDIEALLDAGANKPAAKAKRAWLFTAQPLRWATAALLLLITCVAGFIIYYRSIPNPPRGITTGPPVACQSWPVTSLDGAPSIDGRRITKTGCFETG